MEQTDLPVVIAGAGLAGSVLSVFLARRGYTVHIYERRADFRQVSTSLNDEVPSALGRLTDSQKRSINLALSERGRAALRALGLEDRVMQHVVRMNCRAMHDHDGKLSFQPYGRNDQAIYSVSRQMLNHLLLDEAEKLGNVKLFFDTKIIGVDRDGTLHIQHNKEKSSIRTKCVFGADGAYSAVRSSLLRHCRSDFSQTYIRHGYKELTMPATPEGDFALPNHEALHIWPRHDFMMIALPNPDKTFTCTIFAPFDTFDELNGNSAAIRSFFEDDFKDAVSLIPSFVEQFQENPTGALVTVRMKPWNYKDKIVVVGDAAHAVVPFFGQGMNAAFEDAISFDETLTKCNSDLSQAIGQWAKERQPAGDGIADLSFANYTEMRSHTASTRFLLRKRFESVLHWIMPNTWIPLYTMVAFTRIPYHVAKARAERQERILKGIEYSMYTAFAAGLAAAAFKFGTRYLEKKRT